MEIMKNLNDSEETIFMQAIDQNYIRTKENNTQGIQHHILNEEYSYSDSEDNNKNLNFNFIEFCDDSVENSPNSKTYSNNENYHNSVFSCDSTEAENNNSNPSINTSVANNNLIRKNSFTHYDDNKQTIIFLNEKKFVEEKNLSVNFPNADFVKAAYNNNNINFQIENYNALEENVEKIETQAKKEFNPIKGFLKQEYKDSSALKNDILKQKEKLRKDLNDKLISHKKYLDYVSFYNRNVASGNFLPSNAPCNLTSFNSNNQNSNNSNNSLESSQGFYSISAIDKAGKSIEISSSAINSNVKKPLLSLNNNVFVCGSINKNNNLNNINEDSKINNFNNISIFNNKKTLNSNVNRTNKEIVKSPYSDEDEPNITLSNFIIVSKKVNKKRK